MWQGHLSTIYYFGLLTWIQDNYGEWVWEDKRRKQNSEEALSRDKQGGLLSFVSNSFFINRTFMWQKVGVSWKANTGFSLQDWDKNQGAGWVDKSAEQRILWVGQQLEKQKQVFFMKAGFQLIIYNIISDYNYWDDSPWHKLMRKRKAFSDVQELSHWNLKQQEQMKYFLWQGLPNPRFQSQKQQDKL